MARMIRKWLQRSPQPRTDASQNDPPQSTPKLALIREPCSGTVCPCTDSLCARMPYAWHPMPDVGSRMLTSTSGG